MMKMSEKRNQSIQALENTDPGFIPLFTKLADGRAYTLIELSRAAAYDRQETLRRIDRAIEAGLIRTRENRKRIYYFIQNSLAQSEKTPVPSRMKYCRHCYRHLAGYVGVKLSEALVNNGILVPDQENLQYSVTKRGWDWFAKWGIHPENLDPKRPLTKACLDFSERKNHLGGQLGDALLQKMLDKSWMSRVPDSREIKITREGSRELKQSLDFEF